MIQQPSPSSLDALSQHYATLVEALCDISEVYYLLGRLDEALNVLQAGEQLTEATSLARRDRLQVNLDPLSPLSKRSIHGPK